MNAEWEYNELRKYWHLAVGELSAQVQDEESPVRWSVSFKGETLRFTSPTTISARGFAHRYLELLKKNKPVNPWVPKVGDLVVCDKIHSGEAGWSAVWFSLTMDKLVGVPMLVRFAEYSDWVACDRGNFDIAWLRPATPEEITGYKAKLKAEADAKELAKPIVFGTQVRLKGREDEVWKIGCDQPSALGYWRVCRFLNSIIIKRHEFTILD